MTDSRILRPERPTFPEGYGVPEHTDTLLPWSFVQERMTAARNYWVCTVRAGGAPHVTPVWGAWIDDVLYIEGSRETRRARNLLANPAVTVHLESGDEVVILEGLAREVPYPGPVLGAQLSEVYSGKYGPSHDYRPGPDAWDGGGLFAIEARTVLAWMRFPEDATRFRQG